MSHNYIFQQDGKGRASIQPNTAQSGLIRAVSVCPASRPGEHASKLLFLGIIVVYYGSISGITLQYTRKCQKTPDDQRGQQREAQGTTRSLASSSFEDAFKRYGFKAEKTRKPTRKEIFGIKQKM